MGNCAGACINIFRFKKHTNPQLNILLLGLDGAGKTEVLHILLGKKRDDTVPTNGTKNHNLSFHGIDVSLTELGGSKDIRGIWKHYYQDAHGAIFIVDSTDHNRLPTARSLLSSIFLQSKLTGKPILVLGSKQDQSSAIDYLDLSTYLNVDRMANVSRTPCYVSTIGQNEHDDLFNGMQWLLGSISVNMRRIHNQNAYFHKLDSDVKDGGDGFSDTRPKTGKAKRNKFNLQQVRPKTAPHASSSASIQFVRRIAPESVEQQKDGVHVLDLDTVETV